MEPSTMEPQENLAQNLSIPDFENLMETPLLKSKSISQFHVFSKPSQESERTKPASNFSNSITKEKIRKAMELFNLAPFPTLVQFWAPTIAGENQQRFLDASELPFGLNFLRKGLCLFRKRSSGIRYCVDGDACGPPGRAFRRRFPEFCPDVRCYSVEEFVLKESAKASDVRGYWCVPVFEPGWQCCIGVLEILTIWDGSFGSTNVIDKVSDSLKEVGLRSSDVFWPFDTKLLAYNHSKNGPPEYELALSEIQNVLDVLCKTYSLPFAQTWVVTLDESGKESIMSTAKMGSCMSTIRVSSFRRDCIWFHLRKGQGIVWKAFLSGTPCFCRDITKISIVDYALVLSARKADLTGGFAICLQSSLTGTAVFIIELFLPPNLKICSQPWKFLTSLLVTMKQQFKTFKLSSGQEVGDELPVSVLKISKEDPLDSFIICQTMHAGEGLKNEGHEALQKSCQPLMFEVEANKSRMNYANAKENIASSSFVFECSRNGEMVQAHDATIHNRRNELNARESIFLRPTENGATKTLSLGETISIEVIEEQSGERLTNTPDNLSVNKSMSNRRAQRKRNKVDFSFVQRKSMKKTKQHMVESCQQHQSCYVSPQEESPASISSLSPAATPIHSEISVMTVKAEFEGDTIKFQVPVASGIKKLKDEVMKRLKLTAGSFQIKYHHEDSIWIVLDSDAGLQQYVNAVRSLGISTIKLSIVSAVPQTEAMENAMVESRQQHQSCYASPQEEGPTSISSLSPAAIPIIGRSVMTVKAEFEGDTIKFQVPVASGIKKLKDEVMKRLKLTAGSFQIKYHHEDSLWIVLDSDAGLQQYVNAIRSLGISTIKLSIVSAVPQTEAMENVMVESRQQHQTCCVSPQEEGPASISSLSPAATPIHNERHIMTVKAEFEGDTIKFQVPVASGIKKLKDEVMKRLKLTAGSFQIKYHHEDSIWIVLDSDAGLQEYMNAIRSLGINTIKLSIVNCTTN